MRHIRLLSVLLIFYVGTITAQQDELTTQVQIVNATTDVIQVMLSDNTLLAELAAGETIPFFETSTLSSVNAVLSDETIEIAFLPEEWQTVIVSEEQVTSVAHNTNFSADSGRIRWINTTTESLDVITPDGDMIIEPYAATSFDYLVNDSYTYTINDQEMPFAIDSYREEMIIIADGFDKPITLSLDFAGYIELQHFAANTGTVTFYLNDTPLISDISFQQQSQFRVAPISQRVQIELSDGTVLYENDLLALQPRREQVVTLFTSFDTFAVNITSRPLANYVQQILPENAIFAFQNVLNDTSSIDILLADGTVLAADLSQHGTAILNIIAGDYDILITRAGDPEVILLDLTEVTLDAGTIYDIAFVGDPLQNTQDIVVVSECILLDICGEPN